MRSIVYDWEIERICDFIRSQLKQAGFDKVIVGLSGGIDSSVTAALCTKALGKENVLGVLLPHRSSNRNSVDDALELARHLEIEHRIVDISPMVDAYFDQYEADADFLRKGNRMARERMCVLFDLSAKHKALVAGTGNRSELLIGYCTQYGDNACAFETIGHLYKTEVFKIAKILGVPQNIIDKKPTADLWIGQTDEEEMGISYQELDEILYQMYELKTSRKELVKSFSREQIEKVAGMVELSQFKRNMPPTIET